MQNGGGGSAASGRPSGLVAEHRGQLAGGAAERRRWVCVCDAGQGGFQQPGRKAMGRRAMETRFCFRGFLTAAGDCV